MNTRSRSTGKGDSHEAAHRRHRHSPGRLCGARCSGTGVRQSIRRFFAQLANRRRRSTKPGLGIAFGKLGKIVGAETEIAYQPEVIDTTAASIAKSRVFTFSANTLIGPTIGAVKPYGAIGFGNLNLNVKSLSNLVIPNPTSISSNYFTVNAGGGVVGFPTAHLGVRADLRYFRAYGFNVADLEVTGLSLDRFDFWRANIGLALKF